MRVNEGARLLWHVSIVDEPSSNAVFSPLLFALLPFLSLLSPRIISKAPISHPFLHQRFTVSSHLPPTALALL